MPASQPPRVLVICLDHVCEQLTGVAIRSVELAKVLAAHAEVTVAGVAPSGRDDLPVIDYKQFGDPRRGALAEHIANADVIIAQPPWPLLARWLRRSRARLIYDLYDPEPLEVIERLRTGRPSLRALVHTLTTDRVLDGLASADHLMCASEKQRDLWLGAMLAERLISPEAYDQDPSLRSRLDCVAFGLPSTAPLAQGQGARVRFPQIAPEDELILWNGGLWAWLDSESAIRAMALLRDRRPSAKLVFMGAATLPAAIEAERDARSLAGELGLLEQNVFFNDQWVSYDRRADWLLEADCVLSTQADHLETRFAFRTRILDAFWAGLPIVCTEGDELAERVDREDLGAAVPAGKPQEIALALERVLDRGRGAFSEQIAATAKLYTWPRVAQPLVRWVLEPGTPPRQRRRRAGRAAQRLRGGAFDGALAALNRVGVERLPSV